RFDELRARSGEQRGLCPRAHLRPVQEKLAQPFAERRAAGLAEPHHLVSLVTQRVGEERRLRRLAGAVDAFERDEHLATYDTSMRAVVTGGAGFVGSHLADALVARGDEVVVIDNLSFGKRELVTPAATFGGADVRDGIDAAGADVVFHLAA